MSTRLASGMPKSWISLLIWVRMFYLRNLQRAEVSNVGPCFNQAELVQIRHRRRRRRLGSRIPRETISMAFQRVSSRAEEVGPRHSSSSGRQAHHYHSFRLTLSWPTNFRPDFICTCISVLHSTFDEPPASFLQNANMASWVKARNLTIISGWIANILAEMNPIDYSDILSGRTICRWACPSPFIPFLPSSEALLEATTTQTFVHCPHSLSSKSAFISLFQCHRHRPKNPLSNLSPPRFLCGFCVKHPQHRTWSDM